MIVACAGCGKAMSWAGEAQVCDGCRKEISREVRALERELRSRAFDAGEECSHGVPTGNYCEACLCEK